jgi:hypothetical protein
VRNVILSVACVTDVQIIYFTGTSIIKFLVLILLCVVVVSIETKIISVKIVSEVVRNAKTLYIVQNVTLLNLSLTILQTNVTA